MENSSRHGHSFPWDGEIVGGSQREERFDVLVEK
jgi:aspartyl/asparaginyl-tRNA synthetase